MNQYFRTKKSATLFRNLYRVTKQLHTCYQDLLEEVTEKKLQKLGYLRNLEKTYYQLSEKEMPHFLVKLCEYCEQQVEQLTSGNLVEALSDFSDALIYARIEEQTRERVLYTAMAEDIQSIWLQEMMKQEFHLLFSEFLNNEMQTAESARFLQEAYRHILYGHVFTHPNLEPAFIKNQFLIPDKVALNMYEYFKRNDLNMDTYFIFERELFGYSLQDIVMELLALPKEEQDTLETSYLLLEMSAFCFLIHDEDWFEECLSQVTDEKAKRGIDQEFLSLVYERMVEMNELKRSLSISIPSWETLRPYSELPAELCDTYALEDWYFTGERGWVTGAENPRMEWLPFLSLVQSEKMQEMMNYQRAANYYLSQSQMENRDRSTLFSMFVECSERVDNIANTLSYDEIKLFSQFLQQKEKEAKTLKEKREFATLAYALDHYYSDQEESTLTARMVLQKLWPFYQQEKRAFEKLKNDPWNDQLYAALQQDTAQIRKQIQKMDSEDLLQCDLYLLDLLESSFLDPDKQTLYSRMKWDLQDEVEVYAQISEYQSNQFKEEELDGSIVEFLERKVSSEVQEQINLEIKTNTALDRKYEYILVGLYHRKYREVPKDEKDFYLDAAYQYCYQAGGNTNWLLEPELFFYQKILLPPDVYFDTDLYWDLAAKRLEEDLSYFIQELVKDESGDLFYLEEIKLKLQCAHLSYGLSIEETLFLAETLIAEYEEESNQVFSKKEFFLDALKQAEILEEMIIEREEPNRGEDEMFAPLYDCTRQIFAQFQNLIQYRREGKMFSGEFQQAVLTICSLEKVEEEWIQKYIDLGYASSLRASLQSGYGLPLNIRNDTYYLDGDEKLIYFRLLEQLNRFEEKENIYDWKNNSAFWTEKERDSNIQMLDWDSEDLSMKEFIDQVQSENLTFDQLRLEQLLSDEFDERWIVQLQRAFSRLEKENLDSLDLEKLDRLLYFQIFTAPIFGKYVQDYLYQVPRFPIYSALRQANLEDLDVDFWQVCDSLCFHEATWELVEIALQEDKDALAKEIKWLNIQRFYAHIAMLSSHARQTLVKDMMAYLPKAMEEEDESLSDSEVQCVKQTLERLLQTEEREELEIAFVAPTYRLETLKAFATSDQQELFKIETVLLQTYRLLFTPLLEVEQDSIPEIGENFSSMLALYQEYIEKEKIWFEKHSDQLEDLCILLDQYFPVGIYSDRELLHFPETALVYRLNSKLDYYMLDRKPRICFTEVDALGNNNHYYPPTEEALEFFLEVFGVPKDYEQQKRRSYQENYCKYLFDKEVSTLTVNLLQEKERDYVQDGKAKEEIAALRCLKYWYAFGCGVFDSDLIDHRFQFFSHLICTAREEALGMFDLSESVYNRLEIEECQEMMQEVFSICLSQDLKDPLFRDFMETRLLARNIVLNRVAEENDLFVEEEMIFSPDSPPTEKFLPNLRWMKGVTEQKEVILEKRKLYLKKNIHKKN